MPVVYKKSSSPNTSLSNRVGILPMFQLEHLVAIAAWFQPIVQAGHWRTTLAFLFTWALKPGSQYVTRTCNAWPEHPVNACTKMFVHYTTFVPRQMHRTLRLYIYMVENKLVGAPAWAILWILFLGYEAILSLWMLCFSVYTIQYTMQVILLL